MTLEELLLPDTPVAIRKNYFNYAEEAKTRTFGLLEDEVVVVDTETTGLNFRECELIEIAAARLRGTEVIDRFQTFVHPTGPIPDKIKKLTHISDVDVVDAPSAREAVAAFYNFCNGASIIAHNASFDRQFIESVRGAKQNENEWIDSLALSRIALPRLSSHKLSDMATAFGCDSVTHRAMDDVDALCGMWRIMLVGLSYLPAGLLLKLSEMHEDVEWGYRKIFKQIANLEPQFPFQFLQVRSLMSYSELQPKDDAIEKLSFLESPSKKEIDDAFGEGGYVDQMYKEYKFRDDQLLMAEEVRDALDTSTHRGIEAGTGVGKTVAYLLPSILYAQRNNLTIGIATKTNALTDQLISHELPLLDKVLPAGVNYCSLKGYDHYPCMDKLVKAIRSKDLEMPRDMRYKSQKTVETDILNAIAIVSAYSCQSRYGDLDGLGIRWSNVPRETLTCTSKECRKTKCPFYSNGCFVHGARKSAATSDVVVTNHSLLLRDIEIDNAILPPIRHWIVDEAHTFESEARRQWALELDTDLCLSLLKSLKSEDGRTDIIEYLFLIAGKYDGEATIKALAVKAGKQATEALVLLHSLCFNIRQLGRLTNNNGYSDTVLWIDNNVRQTEEWFALEDTSKAYLEVVDELLKNLKAIGEFLNADDGKNQKDDALLKPLRDLGYAQTALKVIMENKDDSYVYQAEFNNRRRSSGSEKLVAQKVDIGQYLGDVWINEMLSVVFTSATIDVADNFKYFDKQVGLSVLESDMYKNIKLHSSFDYDHNMKSIVIRDLPIQSNYSYRQELADTLYDIHAAMDGSVLTLFTNRRDMEGVFEILQPRLNKDGLALYQQEKGTGARQAKDRFLEKESNSLFALKSFWEGFDAVGDTLRCVVIVKLPFSNPNTPLLLERGSRGENVWSNYYVPDAVIEVKQAAGRLLRSETDTGVLVICDSRLETKSYKNNFCNSLPVYPDFLSKDNIGKYISFWRKSL